MTPLGWLHAFVSDGYKMDACFHMHLHNTWRAVHHLSMAHLHARRISVAGKLLRA